VNDSAESMRSAIDGSVLERQVSNVVFIDHAEDWFLLNVVVLGLLVVLLFSSFQFPLQSEKAVIKTSHKQVKHARTRKVTYESIVADQVGSLLLGLAVVDVQGRGEPTGSKTVQIGLFGAFNLEVGLGTVSLLVQMPVFVPVI